GTAWHASLVGKFLLERLAKLPCEVDYGSEFRYRNPLLDPQTLLVGVSQSGETADTLAAVEAGREKGTPVLAICNVVDSSIARRSSAVLYTHAGPEISVASTKAFTTQLTALYLLGLHLGRQRGLVDAERGRKLLGDLVALPHAVQDILAGEAAVERIARRYGKASDFLYPGRGVNYPVALEGALKLKEISYIHSEGYPHADPAHHPPPAPRLPRRRLPRHRRGPAAQPGQERHRRVTAERRGVLQVAGAALLWSLGGIGIKAVAEPPLKIAAYRSATAAV